MMTLADRIRRGEAAIAAAKAIGRDVKDWENHLAQLKGQANTQVDLMDGPIIAVEICSTVLQAHIWLAFDDSFDPGDGQAVFFVDELAMLKDCTVEQLHKIHALKVGERGLGSRVLQ
jgi:hypothetical protein